jgi:hypothetical protein
MTSFIAIDLSYMGGVRQAFLALVLMVDNPVCYDLLQGSGFYTVDEGQEDCNMQA